MSTSLDIDNVVIARTETSCSPVVSSPELRAAFAEARTVAGLAVVRTMAWRAWAEHDGASYDVVYWMVLRVVRELGLPLNEAQISREVLGVADAYPSAGMGPR